MLTGKYLQNGKFIKDPKNQPSGRHKDFPKFMVRFTEPRCVRAVEQYAKVAEKYGVSLTYLSLAFCLSRWYATSTIIGATTVEQLEEDLKPFAEGAEKLSNAALGEIDAIHLDCPNPIGQLG